MTAEVINNHSKFSKATKLTKFMIYSTCKFSPSQALLSRIWFWWKFGLFSTKPSALLMHPAALSKFSLSTQALSKDGRFDVYFKINTGERYATISSFISFCLISFYISFFSQIFRTSFNIFKKISVTNFHLLTDLLEHPTQWPKSTKHYKSFFVDASLGIQH